MTYIIAVDSGGTFTDTIVVDSDGNITAAKAASTPDDFARGVIDSVSGAAETLELTLKDLLANATLFAHGTTVATNALLTRSGARTGLITTRGHEDALIIGRTIQKVAGRSENEITHLAQLDKADPIIPRPLIKGIRERVDFSGKVIIPLNEEDVRCAVDELLGAGCEAIAVSLLWSFMHKEHECRVREIVHAQQPDMLVSLSHELAPVIKEYERTATTAINTYIGKAAGDYLARLSTQLKDLGFTHAPVIMQSSGGVVPIAEAQSRAAALLASGPAGGVIGAVALGKTLGHDNLITTDVGGTSFDVGLVVDGEPQFSLTPVFSQYHTVLPSIDIPSIGAGGGSIAWIEPTTQLLKVGPQSAGADPGPVCYDAGGTEPTVTDANVVLNRLNPDYFLGGRKQLNPNLARRAIENKIAVPLGMSVEEAALGVVEILDARMADLVRKVTIGRGFDPHDFVLLAFGGAGPLHVGAYAGDVGVKQIIIPAHASEFSAWGIAVSDLVYLRQTSDPMIAPFDPVRLNEIYTQLESQARASLRSGGVDDDAITMVGYIDMRYRGQIHEVRVPLPVQTLDESALAEVQTTFEDIYNRRYGEGASYRQAGIEARTYQVRGLGRIAGPVWVRQEPGDKDASAAVRETRQVYFRGGYQETPIYERAALQAGHEIAGPAIIEAVDTTVLVQPRQSLRIDEYGNSVMGAA
ncbi:MAG: hydantoinase/oxoprolinase family protein [Anaerolineales bacterium]|nr:hydantoinase/oxoprolinase family protein [Anaerolineales bacterium]